MKVLHHQARNISIEDEIHINRDVPVGRPERFHLSLSVYVSLLAGIKQFDSVKSVI